MPAHGFVKAKEFTAVVVVPFLCGVVPLAEMAGFTPFFLQLLALRLDSGHPPSSSCC